MRKATGSYRTYSIPGKTAALATEFLRWRTCHRQNCSLGSCACSEGPAFGHNTLMMMMMIFNLTNNLFILKIQTLKLICPETSTENFLMFLLQNPKHMEHF